jgi:hypothetical protein
VSERNDRVCCAIGGRQRVYGRVMKGWSWTRVRQREIGLVIEHEKTTCFMVKLISG